MTIAIFNPDDFMLRLNYPSVTVRNNAEPRVHCRPLKEMHEILYNEIHSMKHECPAHACNLCCCLTCHHVSSYVFFSENGLVIHEHVGT